MIEVESSLSAFVKRIRGFTAVGKSVCSKTSSPGCRLHLSGSLRRAVAAFQIKTKVVTAFELWPELDERQRVLWPSTIQLSLEYFNSLQEHAVPLNEADLAALAHSAMALDLYAWLAQRLHRVNPARPAFIPWAALKQQFGPDYGRMDNFKTFFRKTLRQVHTRYKAARIEIDGYGMKLHNSPPPVTKRLVPCLAHNRVLFTSPWDKPTYPRSLGRSDCDHLVAATRRKPRSLGSTTL